MRQAVIVAGGKGERLGTRLGDLPKPMIAIGGKPLLEHLVELSRSNGFHDVLILAGHRSEAITRYFQDGSHWGVRIRYQIEKNLMGTAGAVLMARDLLAERFMVLYGDEMVAVDLDRMWREHEAANPDATLLLHPNDHPLDSDLVEVGSRGWITAFHNRPHSHDSCRQNLVNAALYVISKRALQPWFSDPAQLDFGKDLFPAMLRSGCRLFGYRSPEYIKDIGTPERYNRVCAEYAVGVVSRSSLRSPQRAVFLDRDGTLNEELGGVTSPEQIVLVAGAAQAIRTLNHHGIRVIVVTNQPVVAKGFCTEQTLQAVHNRLEMLLGKEGAFIDRIYYCPHHPDRGFRGEIPELKIDCPCRKPKTGLIQKAQSDLNVDLSASWLIGDSTVDIQTARNAGLRSILVRTGHAGVDAKYPALPDCSFDSLGEAVEFLLEQHGMESKAEGGTL